MTNQLEKRVEQIFNASNFSTIMPFPKKNILIEVTNLCNNKCIFCANRITHKKKGFISLDFAFKIMQQIYDNGGREIGLYATGEPFLHPNLKEIVERAKKIGFEYIYLTTNGLLATQENVESLLKVGLDSIKFSINAINKTDYLFIHGFDVFDIVMKNLKTCYQLKQKYNFKLLVSYIATKYTANDKDIIKKFFENFCDFSIIQYVQNQGGLLTNTINKLNIENNKNYFNNNFKIPCFYVFNSITITYDGYLTACCMDFENYLTYANLKKEDLKSAWNNEIIQKLRQEHIDKILSNNLCALCVSKIYKKTIKPLKKQKQVEMIEKNDEEFDMRLSKFQKKSN